MRRDDRVLRIGHRGAAALAPENTIGSFRAALAAGVDLVEFDVLDLDDGALVVAHSRDLHEVSHGARAGTVDGLSLAALSGLVPELPTLEETLAFFASEETGCGLLVDLKLRGGPEGVAQAIAAHGLEERTLVSTPRTADLEALARCSGAPTAFTYPDDRHGLSTRRGMAPVVSASLRAMRAAAPLRVPPIAVRAGAAALSVHHRVVSRRLVERAHAAGIGVLAWTVDAEADRARVLDAGVDGIVTNDPGTLSFLPA